MISRYSSSIFVNCPFDEEYDPLFQAIIFTIIDCGFYARCALECQDGGTTRIDKICKIISECQYSIHDLSRTELDQKFNLPRFNMPLELGLFLGAKRFGNKEQKRKKCLIIDKDKYRFQSYISDISGQDITAHNNKEIDLIKGVRNWVQHVSEEIIPSGSVIYKRYELFLRDLPFLCEQYHLDENEITFRDRTIILYEWIKKIEKKNNFSEQ